MGAQRNNKLPWLNHHLASNGEEKRGGPKKQKTHSTSQKRPAQKSRDTEVPRARHPSLLINVSVTWFALKSMAPAARYVGSYLPVAKCVATTRLMFCVKGSTRTQRTENPVADNTEREDREISKMEKLLGLKKMKKLPSTFESEGLTCIHKGKG